MCKHGCEGQISIYDLYNDSMEMKRDLYVLVENNIYELPICVCDSIEELADFTGDSVERIHDLIAKRNCFKKNLKIGLRQVQFINSKAEKRKGKSKYVRVTINDDAEL